MAEVTIDIDLPPDVTITAYHRVGDRHGFEVAWPFRGRCRGDRCGGEDQASLDSPDRVQAARARALCGQPSFWAYQPASPRSPWCTPRQYVIPPFKRKDASYTYRFEQLVLRL